MFLLDNEARTRECILLNQKLPGFPPNFVNQVTTMTTCYGSSCAAYWRWLNPEKTLGYCSLGGKPEF